MHKSYTVGKTGNVAFPGRERGELRRKVSIVFQQVSFARLFRLKNALNGIGTGRGVIVEVRQGRRTRGARRAMEDKGKQQASRTLL